MLNERMETDLPKYDVNFISERIKDCLNNYIKHVIISHFVQFPMLVMSKKLHMDILRDITRAVQMMNMKDKIDNRLRVETSRRMSLVYIQPS